MPLEGEFSNSNNICSPEALFLAKRLPCLIFIPLVAVKVLPDGKSVLGGLTPNIGNALIANPNYPASLVSESLLANIGAALAKPSAVTTAKPNGFVDTTILGTASVTPLVMLAASRAAGSPF